MKRFREDRPADICFARGTFNAHPYVMGAMQVFLERLRTPALQRLYAGADALWNARARALDARLEHEGLPVRVANLQSVWTVLYTRPSRYHWLFQYYLRLEGLALSWVGTGRLIFGLDWDEQDFDDAAGRIVAAARAMQADGWWWTPPGLTNAGIRRGILRELAARRWAG